MYPYVIFHIHVTVVMVGGCYDVNFVAFSGEGDGKVVCMPTVSAIAVGRVFPTCKAERQPL